jgi:Tol biopolymer transport system component
VREEEVTYPSLSSDGRTLVYEDARPRRRLHRVRIADPQTRAPEPILATTHSDGDADYAPDGRRIVFVSDRSGPAELWLADADGTRPRRLTDTGGDGVGRPRWSPDGEHIAFLRSTEARADLWITDLAGDARRLLELEGELVLSGWSRDGASLYVGSDLGGSWEALRVDAADGALTRVGVEGAIVALESPDGRWLYFSRAVERGIWRRPLDGGAGGVAELVLPSFDPAFATSWSLDASGGLVYTEWRDLRTRVLRLDLETRRTSPLVETPWSERPGIALSPRGDQLVLATTEAGGSDLDLVVGLALF